MCDFFLEFIKWFVSEFYVDWVTGASGIGFEDEDDVIVSEIMAIGAAGDCVFYGRRALHVGEVPLLEEMEICGQGGVCYHGSPA